MVLEIMRMVGGGLGILLGAVVFLEFFSQGDFISNPLKRALARRAVRKDREHASRLEQEAAEQQHRHRMELLKQLEQLAAFEGLANHEKGSEYAKLRDNLLGELNANLEAAADVEREPESKGRAKRSRRV